jgi:hypothetical protein
MNLNTIETDFKANKYQGTLSLSQEFNKMWAQHKRFQANDPEKINKINELQEYFDQVFNSMGL